MPASRYFDHPQIRSQTPRRSEHVNLRVPVDVMEELGKVGRDEKLGLSDTIRLVLARGLAATKEGANADS